MRHLHAFAIPLLIAASAACSQPVAMKTGKVERANKELAAVQEGSSGGAVAGLPFSQGRSFATLDDYLAFLRKRGASDVPWYREIRPGVYELVSRRGPGAQPQIYSREELSKKFGFAN